MTSPSSCGYNKKKVHQDAPLCILCRTRSLREAEVGDLCALVNRIVLLHSWWKLYREQSLHHLTALCCQESLPSNSQDQIGDRISTAFEEELCAHQELKFLSPLNHLLIILTNQYMQHQIKHPKKTPGDNLKNQLQFTPILNIFFQNHIQFFFSLFVFNFNFNLFWLITLATISTLTTKVTYYSHIT